MVKLNIFRGELRTISAKKASLVVDIWKACKYRKTTRGYSNAYQGWEQGSIVMQHPMLDPKPVVQSPSTCARQGTIIVHSDPQFGYKISCKP